MPDFDIALNQPLSSAHVEMARKELNEVPDERDANLKLLKNWLAKQPHLNARTDDLWLLNFLRHSKFNLQKTKERLDYFYTMKTLSPELHCNKDPLSPEIQDILARGIILPLNSPDMYILLMRWDKADSNKVHISNIVKVGLMMFDIYINESTTCMIVGQRVIDDFTHFPLSFIKQASPLLLKKIFDDIQKGYPARVKEVYLINSSLILQTFLNMVKPLLNKKIRKRIQIYGNADVNEMYKEIPKSVLPKEYGGDGDSVENIAAIWKQKVESYRQWFLEDEQYCVDEAKRPRNPEAAKNSFRQLKID